MNEGKKNDQGKLRWDLLPPDAMKELVTVLTKGAEKYADRNWEKGMKYGRIKAALERHLNAWELGEKKDEEFGTHPLAHVMWCSMVLLTYELRGIGENDLPDFRPQSWKHKTVSTPYPPMSAANPDFKPYEPQVLSSPPERIVTQDETIALYEAMKGE